VEAFREHKEALKRHIENTGQFLEKEMHAIEGRIEETKLMVKK